MADRLLERVELAAFGPPGLRRWGTRALFAHGGTADAHQGGKLADGLPWLGQFVYPRHGPTPEPVGLPCYGFSYHLNVRSEAEFDRTRYNEGGKSLARKLLLVGHREIDRWQNSALKE